MSDETGLVERLYDAFARGDVDGVAAVVADDVEWAESEGHPYWTGRPFVGLQQTAEGVFARLAEDFDDYQVVVGRLVGLGSVVLMEGRYTATAKATGRRLDAQVAHVWDVRGGRIVRFQQYVDTAHLREVLGA